MEGNLIKFGKLKLHGGFNAGFVPSPPATGRVFKIAWPIELFQDDNTPRKREIAIHICLDGDSTIGSHSHEKASEAEGYSVLTEEYLNTGNKKKIKTQGVAGEKTKYQSHSVSFTEEKNGEDNHNHVVLTSLREIVLGEKIEQRFGKDFENMVEISGGEGVADDIDLDARTDKNLNKTYITIGGKDVVLDFDEKEGCYTGFTIPELGYYAKFSDCVEKSKDELGKTEH